MQKDEEMESGGVFCRQLALNDMKVELSMNGISTVLRVLRQCAPPSLCKNIVRGAICIK